MTVSTESFGGPDRFTRELGFAHLIETDADLHPLREVPRWTWSGDDQDS